MLSCFSWVPLLGTLWSVALKAPLSTAYSRQEYYSRLLCLPPVINTYYYIITWSFFPSLLRRFQAITSWDNHCKSFPKTTQKSFLSVSIWLYKCNQITLKTILKKDQKSKDITLPTNIHRVNAILFPVVMYRYESWPVKKTELQRIDAFELWFWRVPWTTRR